MADSKVLHERAIKLCPEQAIRSEPVTSEGDQ
jgi:hypothetical protein